MIGRSIPLSKRYQPPSIRIDTSYLFKRNILYKTAIVFWVRGLAQRPRLRGTISYKKLLTGDANTFATILLVDLFGVRLKPGKVPLKPLPLRLGFGEFRRVSHLFHYNFQFFEWHYAFSNSLMA